jgi:hypothetical protein
LSNTVKISRIETTHQLRGVMSALHVKETVTEEQPTSEAEAANKFANHNQINSDNILNWMINEKDNQPPCLIVIVDLMDLILTTEMKGKIDYSDPLHYLHLPYVKKIQRKKKSWLHEMTNIFVEPIIK